MTTTYFEHAQRQTQNGRVAVQCDTASRALRELHRYAARIPEALQLLPVAQRDVLATMLADELLRLHTAAQQALLAVASAVAEVGRDAG